MGAIGNEPIGGWTGLCHASSARIDEAAAWYAANRETAERPIVPNLRARFGLSPLETVEAMRAAGRNMRRPV